MSVKPRNAQKKKNWATRLSGGGPRATLIILKWHARSANKKDNYKEKQVTVTETQFIVSYFKQSETRKHSIASGIEKIFSSHYLLLLYNFLWNRQTKYLQPVTQRNQYPVEETTRDKNSTLIMESQYTASTTNNKKNPD